MDTTTQIGKKMSLKQSEMICSIEGCSFHCRCKGLCSRHYSMLIKWGDPLVNKGAPGWLKKHPLYSGWAGMINRCHNPNNTSYHQYGALGIQVCERWRVSFQDFLADMGERPEGKTLDRIDPKGNYEPGNCRWATAQEQRVNQSEDGKERQRAGASAGATRRWSAHRAEENHHPDWQKDVSETR